MPKLSSQASNAKTTVSGLSSRPAFLRRPAQRSPGLPAMLIISSCTDRVFSRRRRKIHNDGNWLERSNHAKVLVAQALLPVRVSLRSHIDAISTMAKSAQARVPVLLKSKCDCWCTWIVFLVRKYRPISNVFSAGAQSFPVSRVPAVEAGTLGTICNPSPAI